MKILLTVHQFFPDYISGTEVLTYSVARELLTLGHTVHVLTGYPNESKMQDKERLKEYDYKGIHVYQFNHDYVPMGSQVSLVEVGYENKSAAVFFEEILDRYAPDLVHFFHFNRVGTRLIDVAVRRNLLCFYTPTDFWGVCSTGQLVLDDGSLCSGPSCYSGNCIRHLSCRTQPNVIARVVGLLPVRFFDLLAFLVRRVDILSRSSLIEVKAISSRLDKNVSRFNKLTKIFSPNPVMTKKLLEYGVYPDLIVPLEFGIELPVKVISKDLKPFKGMFKIGYIGTLAKHKGCHVLIEAFNLLSADNTMLKIYGSEEDFPDYSVSLRKLVNNKSNIEFCGLFDNSKIFDVIGDLDVLVVPSLWLENTPLVLYSAQAARCPVIASDFSGISEVVSDGANGLLFEPGNTKELAEKISLIIEDREYAKQLSNAAYPVKSIKEYVDELIVFWGVSELEMQ